MADSLCLVGAAQKAATDKDSVLELVATLACSAPPLKGTEPAEIKRRLTERESVASTAIGHGVAIPHCFLEGIDRFVVGLVTSDSGVDFSAPDGEPVQVFFFIVGPADQRNQHVRILSEISRGARNQALRNYLLTLSEDEPLRNQLATILPEEQTDTATERCLLHVLVQDEAVFEPVLEELSARVGGSIAVQDMRSAGSYLHRMPLFAALWSERAEQTIKLLMAIVDKRLLNETVRRINEIVQETGDGDRVLIAAHDLIYAAGSLDF